MQDKKPTHRIDYQLFYPITTRWMDNDIFGHVNNVTYYSYFDTAVNRFLIEKGGFDIQNAPVVGYVVDSGCTYLSSIAYPDEIEAGLRIIKIGNSSVTYGVGIIKKGEEKVSAYGNFTHVFVNRAENRSVPIPPAIRAALQKLQKRQSR